jgi:ComF family protein
MPGLNNNVEAHWHDRLTATLDILFPTTCAFCRKVCQEKPQFPGICKQCLCQLPLRPSQTSCLNWQDLTDEKLPNSTLVFCSAYYQGRLRQALLRMKFGDAPYLAPALASLLIQTINRHDLVFRAVMAVPLHPDRLRERGYNQAGLLAGQIASRLDIPDWSAGLLRIRATNRQSEQPDRYERWMNLSGAFHLAKKQENISFPVAKHGLARPVLLVDDILTTGVTLTEAAKPLWQAGLPVIGMVVASDHR